MTKITKELFMLKLVTVIGVAMFTGLGFAALIIVFSLMGAFFGGIGGWLMSWVFDESWARLIEFTGWKGTAFELGASLGFVSGFLKTRNLSKTKKED